MSLESNKWLLKLNDINKEIWDYTQEIGYDPEALKLSGETIFATDNTKAELEAYREIIGRKKAIEKKIEQVLVRE